MYIYIYIYMYICIYSICLYIYIHAFHTSAYHGYAKSLIYICDIAKTRTSRNWKSSACCFPSVSRQWNDGWLVDPCVCPNAHGDPLAAKFRPWIVSFPPLDFSDGRIQLAPLFPRFLSPHEPYMPTANNTCQLFYHVPCSVNLSKTHFHQGTDPAFNELTI